MAVPGKYITWSIISFILNTKNDDSYTEVRFQFKEKIKMWVPGKEKIKMCVPGKEKIKMWVPGKEKIKMCVPGKEKIKMCDPRKEMKKS